MGMCGPLVAGVCAGPREGLRYQAGRTLSYGLLGGLAGGLVALSVRPLPVELASQVLSLTMALGLLWVAFRLASSAPRAAAATWR
jgi:sulfite exporter TauE/SafE